MLELEAPPHLQLAVDILAAVVFAVSGALVASRKGLDVVGFMWLAVITGIGGGTLRDLLLGVPVFWMVDPVHVVACLVTAVVVHFTAHLVESRYRVLLWFDALGLALVTVAGTAKGLDNGTGVLVAVAMGVVTGSVGGILRDLLGNEPSVILRREIYVSASGVGACTYILAAELTHSELIAGGVAVLVIFAVRVLAIRYNWSLPAYRRRAGRSLEEIEALKQ